MNEWHGLNGVIRTCLGINQNFGSAIFLTMGKVISLTYHIVLLLCSALSNLFLIKAPETLFLVFTWTIVLILLILWCREIYKRICIAGFDPEVVESPTEPKWSSSGTL